MDLLLEEQASTLGRPATVIASPNCKNHPRAFAPGGVGRLPVP